MKQQIKFCKKCLYSEFHPLGITFDKNGICSGCQIHEEKNNIDWGDKYENLKSIVNKYKNRNKTNYDCIVPITGSGDSYFILYIVKN